VHGVAGGVGVLCLVELWYSGSVVGHMFLVRFAPMLLLLLAWSFIHLPY